MQARKSAGLTLREAARRLELSPSYLSKVELDKADPPSADVIRRMATLYEVQVASLLQHAQRRVHDVIGQDVHDNAGLLAFYRMANDMNSTDILSMIQKLLTLLPPDEKARLEAKIKSDFPRLSQGRSFLFASRLRPRFLSKTNIRQIADRILAEHGLTRETYIPPTPIEQIIEGTEGIHLVPSDDPEMQCERDGSPLVLGLTRWDLENRRLIEINESLYESDSRHSRHRLNYTLAHEYWHAIEHLPLMDSQGRRGGLFRVNVDRHLISDRKQLRWWERKTKRKLVTNEDWQEWQAQYFAGEIMMPHWSVRNEFERRLGASLITAPEGCSREEWADELASAIFARDGVEAEPLCELYDVSRQAMAIRLCELDLVQATLNEK
jgi:transcriptional regulator with XRE-family HTH domain/Zn-dependent peptidase ImmA (M78 family)